MVGSFIRPCSSALTHSHTSLLHRRHCRHRHRHRHRQLSVSYHRHHCISLMRFRRSPRCGYENDYIVYSPDYVIPIAQNGKKSLTHEWMAETSGWDSERKEHQFISLELPSIFLVSSRFLYFTHALSHTRTRTYIYKRAGSIYADVN